MPINIERKVAEAVKFKVAAARSPFDDPVGFNFTVAAPVRAVEDAEVVEPEVSVWAIEGIDAPDAETLKSWLAEYEAYLEATGYRRARAAAYPALGDQLDALLKGFAELRTQGAALPPDLVAVIDAWQAVKAAHPKPPKMSDGGNA